MKLGPLTGMLRSAAALVLTAGCTLTGVFGGGTMNSTSTGEKATFGYDLTCNASHVLVGTWTFHDKAAGVNAHGTLTEADAQACGPESQITFISSYQAQPCGPEGCAGGRVRVTATDGLFGGATKNDFLKIDFLSGPYDFYLNAATTESGNLRVGEFQEFDFPFGSISP